MRTHTRTRTGTQAHSHNAHRKYLCLADGGHVVIFGDDSIERDAHLAGCGQILQQVLVVNLMLDRRLYHT